MIRDMLMKHETQDTTFFDFSSLTTDISYLPYAAGSELWTGICVTPDNLHLYAFRYNGLSGQYTMSAECDVRAYFNSSGPSFGSLDISSIIGTSGVSSIYVGNNGTKLYILNTTTDLVSQYTLGTAYDITTATSDSKSFSVSAQDTSGKQIQFSVDGTIMVMISPSIKGVHKYVLSTAWDISTASLAQTSAALTSVDTLSGGVFSHDGTVLTVGCTYSTVSYQYLYTLSAAWDLSTITLHSSSTLVTAGVWFALDGHHSLVLSGYNILKLSHTTPFSFNGVTFATSEMESESLKYSTAAVQAASITDDGLNMVVAEKALIGTAVNTRIYRFAGKYDLNNIMSSTYKGTTSAYTALQLSPDGTSLFGWSGSIIMQYPLSTAFDVSTIGAGSSGIFVTNCDTFRICNGGSTALIGDDSNGSLTKYDLSIPWSFSGTETKGNSGLLYSISAKETAPTGVEFTPDGMTMYICGTSSDSVHQYSLSSAYAIDTCTFVGSISVVSYATVVQGVRVSPDGTSIYVICSGTNKIYQYTLSTPWLVSSAVYSGKSLACTSKVGFYISTDGYTAITVSATADNIVSYTLSTAFDISSAVIQHTVLIGTYVAETTVTEITFSPNGMYMYLVGTVYDTVLAFSLSTAWDISTLSYLGRDATSVVLSSISGLAMSSDGKFFFVIDSVTDSVHKLYAPTAYRPDTKLLYGLQPRGDGIGMSANLSAFEIDNVFVSHNGMSVIAHTSIVNLPTAYNATGIDMSSGLTYIDLKISAPFYRGLGKIIHVDTEDKVAIVYIEVVRAFVKFTY